VEPNHSNQAVAPVLNSVPGQSDGAQSSPETLALMGNDAIARGAWEAGVQVAAAYPGTPSTEILEAIARYPADDIQAQWSPNEKVACDVAIGASFGGVRALVAMKHVGLNVASDSLMSQTYIGVNGGLVLAVCDDPGMHSSQNEQDTRLVGRFAQVPVLEPADAQEALDFTRLAFDLSEQFDSPVILRSTTRLSHCRSLAKVGQRREKESLGFRDDPVKNVMLPGHARQRHPKLLEREGSVQDYLRNSDLIRWETGDTSVGVITLGPAYSYVKEVLPEVSVLKLGMSFPLAEETVRAFCDSVERVIVVEELEPFIEHELHALGIEAQGKVFFPRVGEFSPEVVRDGFRAAGILPGPVLMLDTTELDIEPLVRPPVLCAGCPHITTYMAMRALDARVSGDIGCYTLAAVEPLKAIDTCVSMGSSIGVAIGLAKAGTETKPIVATIGDSTFLHAGIPPLIDAVYNQADITVLLLDNQTIAMTGGQDHPGTGVTLRGDKTHRIDFEELIRSLGVTWLKTVDSYDVGALYQACRDAIEHRGVSVVISNRPCVLDPVKIKGPAFQVQAEGCTACQTCMNLGCPALTWSEARYEGRCKITIDQALCMGCTLCVQICPSDCIQTVAPEAR
jgi:indolepyruvate ferredoxin oxidoreductase alpha subunit